MSKIDFEGEYGSAGSREVYLARIRRGLGLEKASFGGDRSAAGRYAAQQRWKGHKKGETKPAVRERRMAEKFQEGPILKSGFDSLGFPKILTPAEAKERFGENVTMQTAYFAGRGVQLNVFAQRSDGSPRLDTESPEYFAILQALDDVLDQVDTTKLIPDAKNGLLPEVTIGDYYQNSADGTGGYFDSQRNDVVLFMRVAQMIDKSYKDGRPYIPSTVVQVAADAIQSSSLGRNDSVAARIAYGFTVHEMGHWIDYSLGVTDKGFQQYRSQSIEEKVKKDPLSATDDEKRFSTFREVGFSPRGTEYSNTNIVERFAENFTAWFTMTRVNAMVPNQLKSDLASRGGLAAVGAALEVLKQDRIVDNIFNWPPDHPVFLFAFRGEPFDVDAFKQQLLVGMIKASFGGDRSAAGRYAANMRWKGQRKVAGFVGKGVYKLGADGSIHPKALVEEMTAEHPDGSFGYHKSTEARQWKALVAKNIAAEMTDVSTKEILDVLESFRSENNGNLTKTNDRRIRAVLDGKVKQFILTRTGKIINASKEDYLRDELEFDLGGIDLEQRMRMESMYWMQATSEGRVFDADSPEGQAALKQAAVGMLVEAWAVTANDANPLSLAVQDAAQKEFKIDALSWESNSLDDPSGDSGKATYSDRFSYQPNTTATKESTKVLSSFLKAQYGATQQYFDSKGIKEITLFRGIRQKPLDPDQKSETVDRTFEPVNTQILMRPLSSWATRIDIASDFADGSSNGVIVKARIKVKDILSIPFTGVGCWEEAEAVVIGHPVNGSFMAKYEQIRSASTKGEADAFDYRQRVLEWAYENETGEAP